MENEELWESKNETLKNLKFELGLPEQDLEEKLFFLKKGRKRIGKGSKLEQ